MDTFIEVKQLHQMRSTFTDTLSGEFVARTGHGAYVYLSPVDIDQMFTKFLNYDMPISTFARQCAKNVLQGTAG